MQFQPENLQYRKQHQGLLRLQDLSGPWWDPAQLKSVYFNGQLCKWMCDKPRGPPGWWDSTPVTLCSAAPTKGRQQRILQLLASGLLQIMSPSEKIQHKGQKVVWAAEQVARLKRHRNPMPCSMNLRAEVGWSTGKSRVWFYLEWKILLCSVGSSLLPQHARSGQFSVKGHDRNIFTLYFSMGLLKL